MKITDLVFKQIMKLCDIAGCDYGRTEDYFTISRIPSLYTLKNIIEYLEVQNEYEVFVEAQRIDEEIYYFVSGERKNVKEA